MNKKQYQAPVVEQMECKVERGFAGSNTPAPQQMEGITGTSNNYGDALFN